MKRITQGLAVLAAGLMVACGGPKRPDWIMKGGAAFKNNQKMFYGVGVAEDIQSEALRRVTADNRAIAEVSKQISVMSTSLMRDYLSNTSVPKEAVAGQEEQYIENTVKTFTNNVLSGIRIIDRYQDKKNTLYSLASLNVDDLKSLSDNVQGLSKQVREYIKANAEKAFDKLAEEEDKHSGQ